MWRACPLVCSNVRCSPAPHSHAPPPPPFSTVHGAWRWVMGLDRLSPSEVVWCPAASLFLLPTPRPPHPRAFSSACPSYPSWADSRYGISSLSADGSSRLQATACVAVWGRIGMGIGMAYRMWNVQLTCLHSGQQPRTSRSLQFNLVVDNTLLKDKIRDGNW